MSTTDDTSSLISQDYGEGEVIDADGTRVVVDRWEEVPVRDEGGKVMPDPVHPTPVRVLLTFPGDDPDNPSRSLRLTRGQALRLATMLTKEVGESIVEPGDPVHIHDSAATWYVRRVEYDGAGAPVTFHVQRKKRDGVEERAVGPHDVTSFSIRPL